MTLLQVARWVSRTRLNGTRSEGVVAAYIRALVAREIRKRRVDEAIVGGVATMADVDKAQVTDDMASDVAKVMAWMGATENTQVPKDDVEDDDGIGIVEGNTDDVIEDDAVGHEGVAEGGGVADTLFAAHEGVIQEATQHNSNVPEPPPTPKSQFNHWVVYFDPDEAEEGWQVWPVERLRKKAPKGWVWVRFETLQVVRVVSFQVVETIEAAKAKQMELQEES